jgi:trimeric autotransporter adhesin
MNNTSGSFLILLCAVMSGPFGANPKITDANWIGVGQSQGFHGKYAHAADSSGNLYVCGGLYAGGLWRGTIAKWDRKTWSDVAPGINGDQIFDLAFDKAGNLYASGIFDTAGGIIVNKIAKWDGAKWSGLGNGVEGVVNALAVDGRGNLYVVLFTEEPDKYPYLIKKWDGSAWSVVGRVEYGYVQGVNDLVVDSEGNLYACGSFDTISSIPASKVAKWDGHAWSALGSGLRGGESLYASELACIGKDLYVYGSFDTAGSTAIRNVAKWDGKSWTAVGNAVFNEILDIETDKQGSLYLTGDMKTNDSLVRAIAKWDGNAWTVLYKSLKRETFEGGFEPRGVMVDGSGNLFTDPGFLQWRGNSWTPVCPENGVDGDVSNFAIDPTSGNLYASISYGEVSRPVAGNAIVNYAARWDGISWSALGEVPGISENPGYMANALAFDKNGILYAIERDDHSSASETRYRIVKWNGASWSFVDSVSPGRRIYALAIDSMGNLYAGGEFESIGAINAKNIAKWDGSSWSGLGEGIPGKLVRAIVCATNGNVYAGGAFDMAGSAVAHNIAKWDGNAWSGLGEGIQIEPDVYIPVFALTLDGKGNLYAGGGFSVAGTVAAANVAKWDGAVWSALEEGIQKEMNGTNNLPVSALACDENGYLYAGGQFNLAGSVQASGIAKWDGSAWSALGSGVCNLFYDDEGDPRLKIFHGVVSALLCNNKGTLYVGGNFQTAGGKPSVNFAKCNLNGANAAFADKLMAPRFSVAFESNKGLVRMHFTSATEVHIWIYSLSGQKVYHTSEFMAAGDHAFRIKQTGLARGAYIAQVKAGNESLRYRFLMGR